jgi:hypothetical protein
MVEVYSLYGIPYDIQWLLQHSIYKNFIILL